MHEINESKVQARKKTNVRSSGTIINALEKRAIIIFFADEDRQARSRFPNGTTSAIIIFYNRSVNDSGD